MGYAGSTELARSGPHRRASPTLDAVLARARGEWPHVAAVTLQALSGEFLGSTEFLLADPSHRRDEPNLGAVLAWTREVKPSACRVDVIFDVRPGHPVSCLRNPFTKIRDCLGERPKQPRGGDGTLCYEITATLTEFVSNGEWWAALQEGLSQPTMSLDELEEGWVLEDAS